LQKIRQILEPVVRNFAIFLHHKQAGCIPGLQRPQGDEIGRQGKIE
jgi:hypothetical protein